MTCPECGGADLRHVGGVKPAELRHWCPFCGSLVVTKEGRPKRHESPAAAKRHADLRRCLAGLLWPNVPSADDVALMVRMCGTTDTQESAMELVDKLRAAQEAARAALSADEGT